MELKIDLTTAKARYDESPEWLKKQMEQTFGENLRRESWEQITSYEAACKKLGIIPETVFHEKDWADEIAYKKLKVIALAINDGWTPDWSNTNEKKWYPWFEYLSSGFGFSGTRYSSSNSYTSVSSRLCFESQEKASFAGRIFIDLYREFLN